MTVDQSFLNKLRLLSFVEGISTLLLFGVAMPLKYIAGMPMAVRIVGSLHGFLFVALSTMFLMAVSRVPMPTAKAVMGIVAAVIPFGPFIYDRRLKAIGEAADDQVPTSSEMQ